VNCSQEYYRVAQGVTGDRSEEGKRNDIGINGAASIGKLWIITVEMVTVIISFGTVIVFHTREWDNATHFPRLRIMMDSLIRSSRDKINRLVIIADTY